jgi:hypothetical protein
MGGEIRTNPDPWPRAATCPGNSNGCHHRRAPMTRGLCSNGNPVGIAPRLCRQLPCGPPRSLAAATNSSSRHSLSLLTRRRRPACERYPVQTVLAVMAGEVPPEASRSARHRSDDGPKRHMFRRYWPPASNKVSLIWPNEQQRTASISTANTFSLRITAWRSLSRNFGASSAWAFWKARSRSI